MEPDIIAEVRDLAEEALANATDAAAVVASALGIGAETDDGYEVDSEELAGSDDPVAQALARVLDATAELIDALGAGDDTTDSEDADVEDEAA